MRWGSSRKLRGTVKDPWTREASLEMAKYALLDTSGSSVPGSPPRGVCSAYVREPADEPVAHIRVRRSDDGTEKSLSPESPTEAWAGSTGRLFWWDELPRELQYNRYIRSGYRAGLSRTQCLCSVFQYHNETGNIFTHLLPALLLLGFLASGALPPWAGAKLAFFDSVVPTLLCLSGSVSYHTFMANHWNYRKYLLADVCGVFLVLVSGAGSGIYWGLQCYPLICRAFLAAYYLTAAGCIVAGLKAKTQVGRLAPMLALFGVRGATILTRVVLQTGSREAVRHLICMEAVGILGAVVNVLRVPERWRFGSAGPPQRCRKASVLDYWLNSHQLMHILVLAAMLFKYLGTAADYRFRYEAGGACPARSSHGSV